MTFIIVRDFNVAATLIKSDLQQLNNNCCQTLFSFIMKPPLNITTVKSSVIGVGWKPRYTPKLKALVDNVHLLVTHTFVFLKYIFIQELEEDRSFALEAFANVDFYRQVFLSLIKSYKPTKTKRTTELSTYKDLINKHRDTYCQTCSYTPIEMKYAQQIANYEVVKINTAYLNGVSLQFGKKAAYVLESYFEQDQQNSSLEE